MSDDQSLAEHDDLVAAGLYDPAADDAAARLELLTYLTEEVGASIPELVQAQEEGVLVSFPAIRSLRPSDIPFWLICPFCPCSIASNLNPYHLAKTSRNFSPKSPPQKKD